MRYQIDYQILLSFEQEVFEQSGELRLLPREETYQKVLSFHLKLDPSVQLFHYIDAYQNRVDTFSLITAHKQLQIAFQAEVENNLENPFDFIFLSLEEERDQIQRLLRKNPRWHDYVLSSSNTVPSLSTLKTELEWPKFSPKINLLESIQKAMEWLAEHFTYLPGTTWVHCPFQEVMKKRSGVCQDFAHLLIAIVRSWGFPARYVMGYQYSPPKKDSNISAATHAWAEIYLPERGWQGFDPSQQLLANNTYIPVAVGRDSYDAAPQRGCYKGGAQGEEPQIQLSVVQQ